MRIQSLPPGHLNHLAWLTRLFGQFMDRESKLCGFVAAQLVGFPHSSTPIKKLIEAFKHGIYDVYRSSQAKASGIE